MHAACGGKFDSKVYETSGGLHGVGVSVVNALSEWVEVEVARDRQLYRQSFSRGVPQGGVESLGPVQNRRGTRVRFKPDPQIFGASAHFDPRRLFRMARSKAYLFGGVEIRWTSAESLVAGSDIPPKALFRSRLASRIISPARSRGRRRCSIRSLPARSRKAPAGRAGGGHGSLEWAISWFAREDGFVSSYCNTIPTPEGGTHESGLRIALLRGLKDHADRIGQTKRAAHSPRMM